MEQIYDLSDSQYSDQHDTYGDTAGNKDGVILNDELCLLLNQSSVARYAQTLWEESRKWTDTPTGIITGVTQNVSNLLSQNVSGLLSSEEGNTILKNSTIYSNK